MRQSQRVGPRDSARVRSCGLTGGGGDRSAAPNLMLGAIRRDGARWRKMGLPHGQVPQMLSFRRSILISTYIHTHTHTHTDVPGLSQVHPVQEATPVLLRTLQRPVAYKIQIILGLVDENLDQNTVHAATRPGLRCRVLWTVVDPGPARPPAQDRRFRSARPLEATGLGQKSALSGSKVDPSLQLPCLTS